MSGVIYFPDAPEITDEKWTTPFPASVLPEAKPAERIARLLEKTTVPGLRYGPGLKF